MLMKTKMRVVQFWTDTETIDNQRLDSEILILQRRVWERASEEVKRYDRKTMYRTIGTIMLGASLCAGYLWILAR
jgi:hypothetical protein